MQLVAKHDPSFCPVSGKNSNQIAHHLVAFVMRQPKVNCNIFERVFLKAGVN